MKERDYDLAVIGSGPAGHHAAIAAAKLGKNVAIVERRHRVGGVCLHTGTIPSKSLREAILYLTGHRLKGIYGYDYRVKQDITIDDLLFRANHVVQHELGVLKSQMRRNGVNLLAGLARFVDPHTLHIEAPDDARQITADSIIIACGTEPARSSAIPFDDETIVDNSGILKLKRIPKSMLVVGGGVIGLEYACMFAILGVEVTVIEQRPRVLDFVDAQISDALVYHMRNTGVTLRLGETVVDLVKVADGPNRVSAILDSGKRVRGEVLLYAIGRQGTAPWLNLEAAGLDCDQRGRIKVDQQFRTQVEHIYAVGDVIGFPSLASTAMEQGRLAACHAFCVSCQAYPQHYPYGIYTVPEISMVGGNEQEFTQAKVPYEVGLANFREIAKGQIIGAQTGMLKLLVGLETHEILGVHAIGEQATEIIHIGQAVMALGGTVEYLRDAVFNYPTMAECYKVAAFDAINKLE